MSDTNEKNPNPITNDDLTVTETNQDEIVNTLSQNVTCITTQPIRVDVPTPPPPTGTHRLSQCVHSF